MIGRITGILLEKHPPQILVDVAGLGYEIDVPMSTFFHLPATGEKVSLYTHLAVREDAHLLYGFATDAERRCFRELLKVSGIGAKTALAVLSGLNPDDLAAAVTGGESGRLVKIPGIGKKTAERLLLELQGRLGFVAAPAATVVSAGAGNDVRDALLALGYQPREADAVLKQLPAGLSVSEALRQALRLLVKP